MDSINCMTLGGTASRNSFQNYVFRVSDLINKKDILTQEILNKCVRVRTDSELLFSVPNGKSLSSVSFGQTGKSKSYTISAKDNQGKKLTNSETRNLRLDSKIIFVCDPKKQVSGNLPSASKESKSDDSVSQKKTKSGNPIPDLFTLTTNEKLKKALRDSITQSSTHAQNLKVEFNDGTNISLESIIPLRLLTDVNNQKSITLEYFDTSKGFGAKDKSGTKRLKIELENVSKIDFSNANPIDLKQFLKMQLEELIQMYPNSIATANIITINLLNGEKINLGEIVPVSMRDSQGSRILFTYYTVNGNTRYRSSYYEELNIDLSNVRSIESVPGGRVRLPRARWGP